MENQSLTGQTSKDVVWQVRFLWQKRLTSSVIFSVLNVVLHLISLVLTSCGWFFFFPANLLAPFIGLVFTDWVLKNSLGLTLKFRFSGVKRKKACFRSKWIPFQSTLKDCNLARTLQCLKSIAWTSISLGEREKYIQNCYLILLNNSRGYSE